MRGVNGETPGTREPRDVRRWPAEAEPAASGRSIEIRMSAPDRRDFARTPIERPCKIFHHASRQYIAGRTCDLSSGGLLVRLDTARTFSEGDEVDVIVSWGAPAVVRRGSMVPARIARVAASLGEHQAVGLKYAEPQRIAAVA